MDSILLVSTIIAYVLSLAATLILAITTRKLKPEAIRVPVMLHALLMVISLLLLATTSLAHLYHYLVLATTCSGVALAGWAIRGTYLHKALKIYFGLYLLSVLLFLSSPTRLFYILTGQAQAYQPEKSFHLIDNYYLVEQKSQLQTNDTLVQWKVIRKYGIYKKTIRRDIQFGWNPETVKLISMDADTMILRGYHTINHNIDSADTGFKPEVKKQEIKQKR
jgi:hypothetical protein